MRPHDTDLLIIGSGIAGLSMALYAAAQCRVVVLAKRDLQTSNTHLAQGGAAAVVSPGDTLADHVDDTLRAGAECCNRASVESILRDGAAALAQLQDWGVPFTMTDGTFDLHQEGGHTHRRILHVADHTGRAIMEALLHRAQAHPNITLLPDHVAVDLITDRTIAKGIEATTTAPPSRCYGAYCLSRHDGAIHPLAARVTTLATGGAGKVYLYTSNPDIASGDGLAMAYRGGATIENLEFVQFHPTCLFHPDAKSFLISEAVRGEGGVLRLLTGERFMTDYDARGELATRDIVARAIDAELKRHGHSHVTLDISHRPADFLRARFPDIHRRCQTFGIDITRDPIPVVPAAHYFCGGIATDLNAQTNIGQLLAVGEVASTGLHGANRLASNALTESVVMAQRAAAHTQTLLANPPSMPDLPEWDCSGMTDSDESVVIAHNWDEVRRLMWNYVGIVRSDKRLRRAKARIDLLQREIQDYYWNFHVTGDLLELRNIALVADLIIQSAMHRRESRGLHCNLDTPDKRAQPEATRLQRFASTT
jgi:L-aspartate oxidase